MDGSLLVSLDGQKCPAQTRSSGTCGGVGSTTVTGSPARTSPDRRTTAITPALRITCPFSSMLTISLSRPGAKSISVLSHLVEELGVDEVDLPQVRLIRVPSHPRPVFDRRTAVRVALHAEPLQQPDNGARCLGEFVDCADTDRGDVAPDLAGFVHWRMIGGHSSSLSPRREVAQEGYFRWTTRQE